MGKYYNETIYSHDAEDCNTVFCIDANEKWSKDMVKRLKKQFPDEVEIKQKNSDGSIQAYMPLEWMKIQPPKKKKPKRELSEDEKQVLRERVQRAREMKKELDLDKIS